MKKFTAVVSVLCAERLYYRHYGVVCEDGVVTISSSHKSSEYKATEFTTADEALKAASFLMLNSEMIIKANKFNETASEITIDVRVHEGARCNTIAKIEICSKYL